MSEANVSRRRFIGISVTGATGISAIGAPASSAAAAAGIEPGDLPDLTIKQVKVYVVASGEGQAESRIAAIVTNSGIEGNYTLGDRYWHPNWSNLGWLEYAKNALRGKSVLDLPALTSQWVPEERRRGQLSYAAAIDNCLWDILGKAVNLAVYQFVGAYRG
jgi:L-alanine-DL-glutamate epimerase-like enolase superfamily enzyme